MMRSAADRGEALEHARHPLRLLGRHAGGGLVQEEQRGRRRQGHAHLELALLAVGQRADDRFEPTRQADGFRHLGGASEVRGPAGAARSQEVVAAAAVGGSGEPEVLGDGQARKQIRPLEGARNPSPRHRVGRESGDRPAVEDDAAGARRQLPRDEVEQRRLPGAVRPDDGPSLRCAHGERDAIDGGERAETPRESLDGEERRRVRHARSPILPRTMPTIPPGANSTNRMNVRPRISIQRSV